MLKNTVYEPERNTPVVDEYDLCVLGGSCTGVFAAIRAARLGLKVAIVERMGCFGGVATLSLVNIWHSPLDTRYEKPIIGGLTVEVMERLQRRNAVSIMEHNPSVHWIFNSAQLQIELDELIDANGITPWLHTAFVAPVVEEGKLTAIIIENKDGRSALRARFFIDATGDGDLCARLGLAMRKPAGRQPSTTCALVEGWDKLAGTDWRGLLRDHGDEFDLPAGFAWGASMPSANAYMLAGTRVYQDCSDAKGLTRAEIEGRRQVRAICDLLQKYAPHAPLTLLGLPARIGIRQTVHVDCHYQLTTEDILSGRSFSDTIANGSYRVDIHHDDKPGLTFRYLDGREIYIRPGYPETVGRWRAPIDNDPTFYQIPYRTLVPKGGYANLLAAGRFIDTDAGANGAIRVMVTMNQTGEAAGTAAYLALAGNQSAANVCMETLRSTLIENGSILY